MFKYTTMKMQDETPYDSFLLGISNLYYPIGKDKFFIRSPFIESNFQILTTGKTYLVIHTDSESVITLTIANLIDVCFDSIMMNIFLHDVVFSTRIHLEFDIHKQEDRCQFKLIEIDYLAKKLDFLDDNYRHSYK